MQEELVTYRRNLDTINSGVQSLGQTAKSLNNVVSVASGVVAAIKYFEKTTEDAESAFTKTDALLKVLSFVSPLKTPVTLLEEALAPAKKTTEKVNDKIDDLTGKDDSSTPGKEKDGEFLDNLEKGLEEADFNLGLVLDSVTVTSFQLSNASLAMGGFLPALQAATRDGEAWSGLYDKLNQDIDDLLGLSNAGYRSLKKAYDSLKADFDIFVNVFDAIDFEEIFDGIVDMEAITALFDFFKKPLDIAAALIAPIQPLLDAVDALVGLVIDPIIDYVTNTLDIDSLISGVTDKLNDLLPAIDVLDKFVSFGQRLKDLLADFAIDAFGTFNFLGQVEDVFFGGYLGVPDLSPTGWGTEFTDILTGDDGRDILDALGGRDFISAGGGNDIIVAGAGSDSIDGGAGADLFYFDASFFEYELAKIENSNTFIVSHVLPQSGATNTGVDTLLNLQAKDHLVFKDLSFTGAELLKAITGGSVLRGNGGDNLMFLDRTGDTSSGYHIAYGLGGDDRIFGTVDPDLLYGGTGNDSLYAGKGDDILNGEDGNDTLIPGDGDDDVNGGAGRDTFLVLEGANKKLRVDLLSGTASGQGQDDLNSIENIILSPHQDHKVQASDLDNAIFTGDGIDVVSARGGEDLIDSGGDKDFLIAGAGSDTVFAGDGRDVMLSGSRAKKGVADYYDGGGGYDFVGYTSESNTIKFDISDVSDDPSILETFKTYLKDQPASGPVEIRGAAGTILHFDKNGKRLAVDRTNEVEGFIGSDKADLLRGGGVADTLHGAGGADEIYTGGTANIWGGKGNDTIYAQNVEDGATALQIEGGQGKDTLDLAGVGDARWYYKIETGIALTLRALSTTVEEEDLRNVAGSFFSIKPRDIEKITLGNFADHAIYRPGGSATGFFFLQDGNDRFDAEGGFADVTAGDGDDIGNFDKGGSGVFRGEAGNDFAVFDGNSFDNKALMGADQDFLLIERFRGLADGGSEYDTISFAPSYNARIVADLRAGTVQSFKGVATNVSEPVDMRFRHFEELIATNFNDTIVGSGRDEQLVGRNGSDGIDGARGNDRIYGGQGNDNLRGGGGDDLLHGGLGNDTLNGDEGKDTASYVWAVPDGVDGALTASAFGGVTVDLRTGTASGAAGSDTLVSIENVFGSNGNDLIYGNQENNALSGEDGDDVLFGFGGRDVLVTGAGSDVVSAGDEADRVVVGLGTKTLDGGRGFDILDFGTIAGSVLVDFRTGTYSADFEDRVPVWLNLDTNGDGKADSDGTEARVFKGVALTPQMVQEADAFYANSADDAVRVLPEPDDPQFGLFTLTQRAVTVGSSGSFSAFEEVVGGQSGARIVVSDRVDRFDGRNSSRDAVDLSNSKTSVLYNLRNGSTNSDLLDGDEITGVEGVYGSAQDDTFIGNDIANFLFGLGGGDILRGNGGNDELVGGAGQDSLFGGNENDLLRAGNGDDLLAGGAGKDDLQAGKGVDLATYASAAGGVSVDLAIRGYQKIGGREGQDRLNSIENVEGSAFKDALSGDGKANQLVGLSGADTLLGRDGNDRLIGGGDNDVLLGGSGQDTLLGGGSRDQLEGGSGRDTLIGGQGNDRMSGDKGSDRFVFQNNSGRDIIEDFNAGDDDEVIDLSDVDTIVSFRDLSKNHMTRKGSDVVIDDGADTIITLLNVRLSALDAADFAF